MHSPFFSQHMGILIMQFVRGLLAGTWANSMFFTLEAIQVYRYFKTYPEDSRYFRAIVAMLFSNDVVCTMAQYTCVYVSGTLYTILFSIDKTELYLHNSFISTALPIGVKYSGHDYLNDRLTISQETLPILERSIGPYLSNQLPRVYPLLLHKSF